MTTYPDPSIIVAAYVKEPNTSEAATFMAGVRAGELLTSSWTHTEITSAIGIKARMKTIEPSARVGLLTEIRSALRVAERIVVPVADDFRLASELMERTILPLRGGDALHLAIARRAGAVLWTFDKKMAEAGRELGLGTRLLA